VFGKKAFPWWRLGGVGGSSALHTKAGGVCAAAALGLLALTDDLQASPAAGGADGSAWCDSGPSPLSLTALAARPGERKFALAEAACGPLGAPRAPAVAPRLAAQLSLYAEPVAVEPAADVAPASPAVALAPRNPRRAPAASGATVQRIRALVPVVADAAVRHGIDPLLLHAVAHVESRHQAGARSHAGARGVMQVMPGTARRFGLDDPLRELLQPELNVAVGAEYLKTLQKRFGNDLSLVLAAYNAGEGAVEKYGRRIPPYPETQAYVRDVLATYAELRRRLGAPTGVAGSV
jgi:soluble lytic murein transglycosylase-like protein